MHEHLDHVKEGGLYSASPQPSSSFGHHSIVVNGTRFRIGICGIISITVTILLLTLLIIVLLAAAVLLYSPIPLIKFDLIGNITGAMNASLGTLGHAYITPELSLGLKFIL
ncbi:hypothetical protein Fcan01_05158 [Folsomia candida]|uniref:Uncharacterized protein n=1 Tax=Folsomia candida TaxID=158441 RepID=A0A226EPX7_FOLCA|nr:hypothetical protein Fcan01_05158 [Folsomia candida]